MRIRTGKRNICAGPESTVRCVSQPCPLGLGLSRGHKQRLFLYYCPGLAFKGTRAATAILPAATARHPPAQPHRAKTHRPAPLGTGLEFRRSLG